MLITRRDFLKYCTTSAAALGLNASGLQRLEAALAGNGVPTLIWLHGSGCQGDSVSFLNLCANLAPVGNVTAGSVVLNTVNLAYHSVLMASAGETAVTMALQAKRKGSYVLVCEGAVPTIYDGHACNIMTINGQEKTYQDMLLDLAPAAAAIVCVGTCASFGGIPRSSKDISQPNGPTNILSVKETIASTGKSVINIPGCPAHPEWIAWAVVQLILGNPVPLDNYNRPTALFGNKDIDSHTGNVHENCPRNPKNNPGNTLADPGEFGTDLKCLENLGCRGPSTFSDCPSRKWNNGENGPVNWCVDANGLCFGCVEPDFPGGDFYAQP